MATYQVLIDLQDGQGWRDLYDYGAQGEQLVSRKNPVRKRRLHSGLKPTLDTVRFDAWMNTTLANELLTQTKQVLLSITRDGSAWFSGYLRPVTKWTASRAVNSITFEGVDKGYALKVETGQEYSWSNMKICDPADTPNSLVHEILKAAGYDASEIGPTVTISDTLPTFAYAEEDTWWEKLEKLLYEYHHVFYHDEGGVFRLHDFSEPTVSSTATVNDLTILSDLEIEIDDQQKDAVRVNYGAVAQRGRIVHYAHLDNVTNVGKNLYYPTDGNANIEYDMPEDFEPIGVYNSYLIFDYYKGSVVRLFQDWVKAEILPNADVSVVHHQYGLKSGSYRIQYGVNDEWVDPVRLMFWVGFNYIAGRTTTQQLATNARGSFEEIDTSYLIGDTNGQALAQAIANYYEHSKYKYRFTDDREFNVGDQVTIENTATNSTVDARIVEAKSNLHDDTVHDYLAEAIAPLGTLTAIITDGAVTYLPSGPEIADGIDRATAGLLGDGRISRPVGSNYIEEAIDPAAGAGLYLDSTYLGFSNGTDWTAYIKNDGTFKFLGDAGNYIEWNGATMAVHGDMYLSGSSTVAGTISAGAGLTVDGDITLSSGQLVAGGTTLSGSGIVIGQGSINLGTGAFVVDTAGNVTANNIDANGGTLASLTVDGTITVGAGGSITSTGYTLDSSGLSATGADIEGAIEATTGKLVDLSIDGTLTIGLNGSIVAGGTTLSDGGVSITEGSINLGTGAFVVTNAGDVTANSLDANGGTLGSLTVDGTLSIGTGGSLEAGNTTLSGSGISILQGSINLGSGTFTVDSNGALYADSATIVGQITATSGSFTGSIDADSGTIGGWSIHSTSIQSAADGSARVELNPGDNRVEVWGTGTTPQVAMGYLGGLSDPTNRNNTLGSNVYGFWSEEGDTITLQGDVSLNGANFALTENAAIDVNDGDNEPLLRFGDYNGSMGLHWFYENTTGPNYRYASLTPYADGIHLVEGYDNIGSLKIDGNLDIDQTGRGVRLPGSSSLYQQALTLRAYANGAASVDVMGYTGKDAIIRFGQWDGSADTAKAWVWWDQSEALFKIGVTSAYLEIDDSIYDFNFSSSIRLAKNPGSAEEVTRTGEIASTTSGGWWVYNTCSDATYTGKARLYHSKSLVADESTLELVNSEHFPGTPAVIRSKYSYNQDLATTSTPTFSAVSATFFQPASNDSYDQLRVYSSSIYTIGMKSSQSYGYLNDWAMTFTMNNGPDQGFLWRDTVDAASDGAMSLTTDGRLKVKSFVDTPSVYIEDYLYHKSDTDTYLRFLNDTFEMKCGAATRFLINAFQLELFDDVIPSAGSSHTLGSSSRWWSNTYSDALYTSTIYVNDTTLNMVEGDNNSLRVQTGSGWVEIGPHNTTWCHFYTDRSEFYFGDPVRTNGSILPYQDTTWDLGRSDRQWASVYAFNYVMNGYPVVTRGESNGYHWTKFGDGTMICWFSGTVQASLPNAYGSLWQGTIAWSFPQTFVGVAPAVVIGQAQWGSGASWGTQAGPSNGTGFTMRVIDILQRGTGTVAVQWAAIGKWK